MAIRNIRKARSKKKINYNRNVLLVFRSNKNILAQVLEPETKKTLFTVASYSMSGTKAERAQKVGQEVAKKAKALKIEELVFDRNGYIYHGRVKALAEAVKENGIKI